MSQNTVDDLYLYNVLLPSTSGTAGGGRVCVLEATWDNR